MLPGAGSGPEPVTMVPGMHIQECPHSVYVGDGGERVILRIEHATGTTVIPLSMENADIIGIALRANSSVVRARQSGRN